MIKSFVEKILELAVVESKTLDGRLYTTKKVHPVYEPEIDCLGLCTLTGIQDYIAENLDRAATSNTMIHVQNYRTVRLVGPLSGDFLQRQTLVSSQAHECGFPFDRYLDREEFQVGLMSAFMPTPERDQVLRYVSGIVQSAEVKTADDGISQRVTAKAGIARIAEVDLPNPVKLQPYRTFIEAAQPESEFVFRVRQDQDCKRVTMALFEADGGRWKLEAALNIKDWLLKNIPEARVIV
ncbi:MAG: hypothetical protein RBR42_04905 [Desulfomicrobium sp.]|nr:hypothetical protein [Desulfomicrobium sp.]